MGGIDAAAECAWFYLSTLIKSRAGIHLGAYKKKCIDQFNKHIYIPICVLFLLVLWKICNERENIGIYICIMRGGKFDPAHRSPLSHSQPICPPACSPVMNSDLEQEHQQPQKKNQLKYPGVSSLDASPVYIQILLWARALSTVVKCESLSGWMCVRSCACTVASRCTKFPDRSLERHTGGHNYIPIDDQSLRACSSLWFLFSPWL